MYLISKPVDNQINTFQVYLWRLIIKRVIPCLLCCKTIASLICIHLHTPLLHIMCSYVPFCITNTLLYVPQRTAINRMWPLVSFLSQILADKELSSRLRLSAAEMLKYANLSAVYVHYVMYSADCTLGYFLTQENLQKQFWIVAWLIDIFLHISK